MSPKGDTVQEKRANALSVRGEVVEKVKQHDPRIGDAISTNPGYMVWSATSIHPGLASVAAGWMAVTDNTSGKVFHRKFFRFGIGPGLAIKGFYGLAVIKDDELLAKLMSESSFNMGAGAEASFVFGTFGGSAVAMSSFTSKLETDIHTHTGFSLELLLAGLWSWPNKALNEADAKP
jgi:hypothetical protein